ncbi:hypothetical protein GYMLUDRAFT_48067 [Collybiopsis luxurians FD-317 M1]|uniref:ZIP-like iron-zinc transporter n=1 Tax=Collybiopsis luxurians FD-317 M1 TaxID=944289 RepID=A0A0D0BK82_9AGAR|nr:hypothetical protein GYMLUDRAFT_48067 [Collybiopsis luxurians FD-317 M1]
MSVLLQNRLFILLGLLTFCILWSNADKSSSSLKVTDQDLKQCNAIQELDALKIQMEEGESPIMRTIFGYLFPFGPAWNSILGTFYISSVPNFILAFIPSKINGDTLNTMTAFATGGLLSDVFLHLVPHSFMGEHQDSGVHFIMVEEKRNILTGLGIFLGFAAFFFMEKTLRVLGGEDEEGSPAHSHSHSHSLDEIDTKTTGKSSVVSEKKLESRAKNGSASTAEGSALEPQGHSPTNGPSKLSAYLNLFGDFVHNIMAASFYASPLIGATTTLACFAHEIPHEIADYSILIRSGFTKKQAMQSQFLTAIGAFVGTFIGIAVRNATTASSLEEVAHAVDFAGGIRQDASGLLGTTLLVADLVIPFVAGGFLYIGAVAVLPTLLADSKSGKQALREFAAMFFGVACMFFVA